MEENAPTPLLLHGDLHHGNVLSDRGSHRAIDPHGAIGDPAHEIYSLLLNPIGATAEQLCRLIPSRLAIVAEVTGLDPRRLREWGFCGAAMSMAWDVEEGAGPSAQTAAVAEALLSEIRL